MRTDIQNAMGKMNTKLGGKREIVKLDEHLWPDEHVGEMTTGYYGGGTGLIVLTDRRLFFLKDGWVNKTHEDFPLEKVSSVAFSSGLLLGKITVFASGNKAEIENVEKKDGKRIVDNMRARLSAAMVPAPQAAPAAQASSPIEQLKELGALREAGVVSDQEFAAKKVELLARV
jgi:hypothetical protein